MPTFDLNGMQHLILAIMTRRPGWDWTREGIEEEMQTCRKSSLCFVRAAVQDLLVSGYLRPGEEIRVGRRRFKTFRKMN